MKKFRYLILGALIALSGSTAFANVVVTETTTWRSVPITVDTSKNTYSIVGTVPTDTTEYYYSYSGYRCFREERNFVGVNSTIFKAGVSGGTDIYCYPVE